MLSVFFGTSTFAYDVEVGGVYYNLNTKEKVAEVTSGDDNYEGHVVIPSSITVDDVSYQVVEIKENAFKFGYGMKSVAIPSTITRIGIDAFQYCTAINAVKIEDLAAWCSIKFENNYSNPLFFAGHLTLNDEVITDLVIPNTVTSIGDYAFYYGGIASVTIPSSVKSIGKYALAQCKDLKSLTVPSSVESIGEAAFFGSGLVSFAVPASVKSIEAHTFYDCDKLASIIIPNSVTSIGKCAFAECIGLSSVTIPSSVASIESHAFFACQNLKSVTCLADNVANTSLDVFMDTEIEEATLAVPEKSLQEYKSMAPWSGFGTIMAFGGTSICGNPTISNVSVASANGIVTLSGIDANGQVSFYSADGKELGAVDVTDGTVRFAAKAGSVVVAKIGNESVKIAVR